MSDMMDHLFISAGMHYYVAGRYAVFAGLNPTAANLLHHAVEMALKGALAKKGMDLKALKGLSHDLPRIWREFTAQYGIDGSTFDGVIAELQKFETVRYPDEIIKQGPTSSIGRGKPSSPSGHMTPLYGSARSTSWWIRSSPSVRSATRLLSVAFLCRKLGTI